MKIKIKYFARYRELLGTSGEDFECAENVSVGDVIAEIKQRGGKWLTCFDDPSSEVLMALNHEIVSSEVMLSDNDELAVYPPVTGG